MGRLQRLSGGDDAASHGSTDSLGSSAPDASPFGSQGDGSPEALILGPSNQGVCTVA